eukprot:765759-Hanusia_phi.AAC.5
MMTTSITTIICLICFIRRVSVLSHGLSSTFGHVLSCCPHDYSLSCSVRLHHRRFLSVLSTNSNEGRFLLLPSLPLAFTVSGCYDGARVIQNKCIRLFLEGEDLFAARTCSDQCWACRGMAEAGRMGLVVCVFIVMELYESGEYSGCMSEVVR